MRRNVNVINNTVHVQLYIHVQESVRDFGGRDYWGFVETKADCKEIGLYVKVISYRNIFYHVVPLQAEFL